MCLVEKSMEAQEQSGQEQENLAGDVMDSVGMGGDSGEGQEPENTDGTQEGNQPNAEQYAKKRINARNRERERQMQYMQAKIAELESRMTQPSMSQNAETMSPHDAGMQTGDMAEHIHRAVNQVLAHRDAEERKIKQAQEKALIDKQYEELHNHLDKTADKYDDFDDVVRGTDAPFTKHMRDASLFLPQSGPGSAGEVLYKLGKNKPELERISKLHPLEQARELNRLSHALANGAAQANSSTPRPMGNIKSNPVNTSHAITDKTSPAEIRARMKEGRFK